MAVRYERDDERRRIALTIVGPMGVDEMIAVLERQAADGAWSYAMLQDSTALTSLFTRVELDRIAGHVHALNATHGPRGPVAVVVGSDAAFGVGRMYEITHEATFAWRVFRTRTAAEAWLADRGW